MRQLVLYCEEKNPDAYFPQAVKNLVHFLERHHEFWPIVASYLRHVFVNDPADERNGFFDDLIRQFYSHIEHVENRIGTLKSLLEAVYSLPADSVDPRGLVVEFLVYNSNGVTLSRCFDDKKFQCSLRWKERGTCSRVVNGKGNWDVGFLAEGAFEVHECKTVISNFFCYDRALEDWPKPVRNKLRYMADIHCFARTEGLRCAIFLTGLDPNPQEIVNYLKEIQLGFVQVIGARQMANLLAS